MVACPGAALPGTPEVKSGHEQDREHWEAKAMRVNT